eukprot:Hpha_TRINITY_DN15282_c4_g2::TRINITY_DN15282_c4_g2_i10::g.66764::m.66764
MSRTPPRVATPPPSATPPPERPSPVLMLRGVPVLDEGSLQVWASRTWSYIDDSGTVVTRPVVCTRGYQLSARSGGNSVNAFIEMQSVEDAIHLVECFRRSRDRREFTIRGHTLNDDGALVYSVHGVIKAPSRGSTPAVTPRSQRRKRVSGTAKSARDSPARDDDTNSPPAEPSWAPPVAQPQPPAQIPVSAALDESNSRQRVLLTVLKRLTARIAMDDIFWVFSQFGVVQRLSSFERAKQDQVLVQFERPEDAHEAFCYLNGRQMQKGGAECTLAIVPSALQELTFKEQDERNSAYDTVNSYIADAFAQGGPRAVADLLREQQWAAGDFMWRQWVQGDGWLVPSQGTADRGRIPRASPMLSAGGEGHCLHISGLPPQTMLTARMLFRVCAMYGHCVAVKLLFKHQGCALVQYASRDEAERARSMLTAVNVSGRQWEAKPSKHLNATHWRGAGTELDDKMCTAGDLPPVPTPDNRLRPLVGSALWVWGVPPGLPPSVMRVALVALCAAGKGANAQKAVSAGRGEQQEEAEGGMIIGLHSSEDCLYACAMLNGASVRIRVAPAPSGSVVSVSAHAGGDTSAVLEAEAQTEVGCGRWSGEWTFELKVHPGIMSSAKRVLTDKGAPTQAPHGAGLGAMKWTARRPSRETREEQQQQQQQQQQNYHPSTPPPPAPLPQEGVPVMQLDQGAYYSQAVPPPPPPPSAQQHNPQQSYCGWGGGYFGAQSAETGTFPAEYYATGWNSGSYICPQTQHSFTSATSTFSDAYTAGPPSFASTEMAQMPQPDSWTPGHTPQHTPHHHAASRMPPESCGSAPFQLSPPTVPQ